MGAAVLGRISCFVRRGWIIAWKANLHCNHEGIIGSPQCMVSCIVSLYTLTLQKREILLICLLIAYWESAEKAQYPNWVKLFKALSCPADLILPVPTQAGMPLKNSQLRYIKHPLQNYAERFVTQIPPATPFPSGPSLQEVHTDSAWIKRICHNKKKIRLCTS